MKKMNDSNPAMFLRKVRQIIIFTCYGGITFVWAFLTFSIFVKGSISSPFFLNGVYHRILHLINSAFLNDREILYGVAKFSISYIVILYLALVSNFFFLFWKWKKTQPATVAREISQPMKSIHSALKWTVYACFLAVTLTWCFYTIRLVSNLTKSKYGVESIIRQEAPSANSKDQPLFVNSEIKGMTFDNAARLISIVYLKYIGLIYLEALLIFLVLVVQRNSGKRQSKAEIKNGS